MRPLSYSPGRARDAAYGRDDPDLIARAYAAVSPQKSLECGLKRCRGLSRRRRLEGIGLRARQSRPHIVGVHMTTRSDVGGRPSDRPPILQNGVACLVRAQGDLLPSGHGFGRHQGAVVNLQDVAHFNVAQYDSDGVIRVKTEEAGGQGGGHDSIVTGVIR